MDAGAQLRSSPGRGPGALLSRVVILPYSERVARRWGELQAQGHLRGSPRPASDTWVAACCLARNLPLATLNIKHFAGFEEHEGLELIK